MSDEPEGSDKVALELQKLRWELSFWARAAAVAVPIAAFVVAAAQTYIAVQDSKSKDLLALRDLELKRIESGEKLVEFTNAQTQLLLSADLEKRTQALTYASTLLPPQQACLVINAVIIASPGHADFIAPAQRIRSMIVKQHPEVSAPIECTTDGIFDTQMILPSRWHRPRKPLSHLTTCHPRRLRPHPHHLLPHTQRPLCCPCCRRRRRPLLHQRQRRLRRLAALGPATPRHCRLSSTTRSSRPATGQRLRASGSRCLRTFPRLA